MIFVLFATTSLLIIHHGQCAMQATANVQLDGTSQSIGTLQFYQSDPSSAVKITGALSLSNASSNLGFHVHAVGVSESMPNCTGAGSHFNPYNTSHGPREANITSRHVGDLGNIATLANGTAIINIEDKIIQLYPSNQSIINLSIVVHYGMDDGGSTGIKDSTTTGNAGGRVACGLIKLASSNGLMNKPTLSTLFLTIVLTFVIFLY
ncbi:unnamed protein product [Adineta ricciae]|uniref:Superoxide dismutase [Cu-Zn] n=1 Tax=Adineta ricciae TaxID=249248 RepID=A0A813ZZC0_ADIRI|nr:unnamed protein product [Adineta ricciae]